MAERQGGRVGKRLKRILLMLPYVIANPGVEVSELAQRFGAREEELIRDLEMLFLCGLPGYGPGDLIEVSLDGDRVYVDMADYFRSPQRITPAEALALYAGGAAVASLPGLEETDALSRALDKLRAALGPGAAEAAGIEVRLDPGSAAHLEALQDALGRRLGVEIEYLAASSGELTERRLDPWGLIAALGHWYVVGLDHRSNEERMFRTDRIKRVTVTEEAVAIPSDFDPDNYRGAFALPSGRAHPAFSGRGSATLSFEISPAAAAWFEDYYPVTSSEELDDGWRRVSLVAGGERWAATLVVRLGPEVRAVEPPEMLAAAGRLASSIAARYA